MIYIAIVSHGHESLLIQNQLCGLLPEWHPNTGYQIWIKDNRPSAQLKQFCQEKGIHYLDTPTGLGFGENNNVIFHTIEKQNGIHPDDYFVCVNPDVIIKVEDLQNLVDRMKANQHKCATLNLFEDAQLQHYDLNIRHYPQLNQLLSFIFTKKLSTPYNKAELEKYSKTYVQVDWASGALLAFKANHYQNLQGFDKQYFMYFEDVDICLRSTLQWQEPIYYYPHIKAIHVGAHQNRHLFSKHAWWYFVSYWKFMKRKLSL